MDAARNDIQTTPDKDFLLDGCTSKEMGRNFLLHRRSIERVIEAMRQHLDRSMDNQQLAEIACISPYHFSRTFHRITGVPPVQFHYALRLQHAKQLLLTTNLPVTDICFEVGYNSLGTFSTRFTQLIGIAPSAFRSFARRVSTIQIDQLLPPLANDHNPGIDDIAGTLHLPAAAGLTFVAVFRRAIPEGSPVSCGLTTTARYHLPQPGNGHWRVFSLAVPRQATLSELLTLDHLPRGRSGLLTVEHGRWWGDSSIWLDSPRLHHPPTLLNLPMLINRALAGASVRLGRSAPHTAAQQPRPGHLAHGIACSRVG